MAEVNLHDFTMHTFQLAFLMHEVFPKCEFLFQLVIWCLEEYFDNCFQLLILNFQVGHLEEQYQEWVHQPVVSKEGPRFFENGVLEVNIFYLLHCIASTTLKAVFWWVVYGSVLDMHEMVGSSSYLVACRLLVPEYFYPDGPYNYRSSYDGCLWNISVDTDRICVAPILVPHKH